jgi:hypothetical protein
MELFNPSKRAEKRYEKALQLFRESNIELIKFICDGGDLDTAVGYDLRANSEVRGVNLEESRAKLPKLPIKNLPPL